jgi:hypothetical protein
MSRAAAPDDTVVIDADVLAHLAELRAVVKGSFALTAKGSAVYRRRPIESARVTRNMKFLDATLGTLLDALAAPTAPAKAAPWYTAPRNAQDDLQQLRRLHGLRAG